MTHDTGQSSLFSMRFAETQHVYATPWVLWRVLTGFDAYGRWNSLIPQARGRLDEGAVIQMKIRAVDKHPWPYQGRAQTVQPYQGLALRLSLFLPPLGLPVPYIVDMSLAAYIDPLDQVSSKFTLGLKASGLLVALLSQPMERRLGQGLTRMGGMIKALAEGHSPNA